MSIDASSKSSGIAIFNNKELEFYDCITASSTDLIKRIQKMSKEIQEILNKYNVEKIILEEVRPENGLSNLKTHKALMWLQAAIAFMVHDNFPNIEIIYVYPSEWRSNCGIKTGQGIKREELKKASIDFSKKYYKIDVNNDIADAVGIGHSYVNKKEEKIVFRK
jgi:Holliday junction resolvasome RuvABC endonuclease subunit